jgi:hypothetical protein
MDRRREGGAKHPLLFRRRRNMAVLYDPPSGWMYGFPKKYEPLEGESLKDTLLRDGYPQSEIDNGMYRYCRFINGSEELKTPKD